MMKLVVLVDNVAGNKCMAEHGLSFFIEAGKTVLFDTGASGLFLRNAHLLGINLQKADFLVLSHGHYDHSGGLDHLKDLKLVSHPHSFIKRFRKADQSSLGIPFSFDEIKSRYHLILTKDACQLSDQIWFLGEIPRINDFEAKETAFLKIDDTDDFVMDDSGLVITTEIGLVVITGCAHAGICNTVEHAIKITGHDKVHAVVGGFHLKQDDELTRKTIAYFKMKKVEQVIPSHCTALPALAAIHREFPFVQIKAGNVLRF